MASDVWGLAPVEWDVIGTLVGGGGLLVAGVSAAFAARQYWASKEARLDQTRPYVVVSAVPGRTSSHIAELLIQNVGSSPAFDVTISVTPDLETSIDDGDHAPKDARLLNHPTPMLPPGFEFRMFLDSMIDRHGKDLCDEYEAAVSYNDGRGNSWANERNVIDLATLEGVTYVEALNLHHIAKNISALTKKVGEIPKHMEPLEPP